MDIFAQEIGALKLFYLKFINFVPRILTAIIILVIGYVSYRILDALLIKALDKAKVERAIAELFTSIVKYVIIVLAVIMAADQVGVKIMPLLGGLGIAGIAIGFAAKDTLSNMIAGIIILWDKPFRVGDMVEIADTYGKITKVTLRSTRMRTLNNEIVSLPNSLIVDSKIINHTLSGSLRLGVPIGIAYKEDIDEARRVLLSTIEGDGRISTNPAPDVVVTDLGDSSVNLELRVWPKDIYQEVPLRFELQEKMKKALDAAGIEIPFPYRQVFIEYVKGEDDQIV